MSKPKAKQMLKKLLADYENLQFENWALTSILMTSPSEHTRKTWRADLQKFFADAELVGSAHEKFVPLYAEIDKVDDETAVLELLAKLSLKGKPN